LIALSNTSYSQGIRFGIFTEPKISWLTPDVSTITGDGGKLGFNVGLILDSYFTKNYAFATGISINNVGGKLLYTSADSLITSNGNEVIDANSSVKYKFQYVNIPLGLKLKTNEMGYISFCSNVGITPQIKIKSTAQSDDNEFNDVNIDEEVNLFNLGYHIGAGIEYSIGGNSAITVNIIYTNGFLDITKREEDKIVMSNVALKIGLMF
ncbi:porin family protein, partial [Bacteroidota bacterium]